MSATQGARLHCGQYGRPVTVPRHDQLLAADVHPFDAAAPGTRFSSGARVVARSRRGPECALAVRPGGAGVQCLAATGRLRRGSRSPASAWLVVPDGNGVRPAVRAASRRRRGRAGQVR